MGRSGARALGRPGAITGVFSTLRVGIAALILLLVLGGIAGHVFSPLDKRLTDARFGLVTRPPTGNTVFVEIDPASLRQVGVWPWPRTVYARLLDRLMALGAGETVLDVDFSSKGEAGGDDALQAALRQTGGYAALAGFRELASRGTQLVETLPLARFRAAADVAMVNVLGAPDGVIRRYPAGAIIGGQYYPSLAEFLSGRHLSPGDVFDVDYGIDARAIDRISAADILAGRIDARRVAGKQVVIGASAEELRDFFTTPVYRTLPGGLLQILAAESLAQGRALQELGPVPATGLALLVALLFIFACPRLPFAGRLALLLAVIPAGEGGALLLQATTPLLAPTAPLDAAALAFALAVVIEELVRRRRLHVAAARERDAVQRMLDQVIADNLDGVLVIDADRRVVANSAITGALLGQDGVLHGQRAAAILPDTIAGAVERAFGLGAPLPDASKPAEITMGEAGARRTIEYALAVSQVVDARGDLRPVVCLTFRDITARRRGEERLAYLARHDALTGVLSRPAFMEAVAAMVAKDSNRDRGVTVFAVDLGGFGRVNELFGYSVGDSVLHEAAQRLERLAPLAVGRIGGDGFAVAKPGGLSAKAVASFADEVVATLTRPYSSGGHSINLSAHIGIAGSATSDFSGDQLLVHADLALVSGKAAPGSSVCRFSPALLERFMARQRLETALRDAIGSNRLVVHYQPQIELMSGRLAGVEALVRWNDPDRGLVPPGEFIAIAEETGLIVDLGRFVMARACRDLADWPEDVRVAVNVSPVQFETDDVAAMVRHAAQDAGINPARIEVEITEGVFARPGEAITDALDRLRLSGIGIALDDFGTGYSSLGQLDRLPVDTVKIDRGFVAPLPGDAGRLAIVNAMLTLARTLGKRVVAEGIETEAQANLLRSLGCAIGQGYRFDKPLAVEELRRRYLRRSRLTLVAKNG